MRRAWGLAIGVCTLVALTGVAGAAEGPVTLAHRAVDVPGAVAGPVGALFGHGGAATGAGSAGSATAGSATAGSTTAGSATAGAAGAAVGSAARAAADSAAGQTIGTIETVSHGLLGYLSSERTMTFHYPDASYVKVHFTRLLMLPGDRITVSDPQGQESYTYTSQALAADGKWAMSITGDTAVVTLRPEGADPLGVRSQLAALGVTIDRVARGFSAKERAARALDPSVTDARPAPLRPGTTGHEESVCGSTDDKADAVCYKSSDPVAYNRSKAVARLLINGVELCSGWRVGPDNRMFTNHHCFSDTYDAQNTEVWFNYECAVCGGWDVLRSTKVMGDQVLATDSTLDYTLFSVQNFDEVTRYGYLDLDLSGAWQGEELYIPQHPAGDPTEIAMQDPDERNGNCAVSNPNYDGYARGSDISYYCDTAGGSSGSPVISRQSNKVIALHHFGGCPNSGVQIGLIEAEVRQLL